MDVEKNIVLEAWKICSLGKHKNAEQYQKAYDFIEQFKKTSPHSLEIGFQFAYSADSFELGHFGLQLITDLIKFKWKDLTQQIKLDIKNKLIYLISNLNKKQINNNLLDYPLYFKNTLCLTFLELIKREWPQNWPTLLNELDEISNKSVDQKILVLIIYKFLVEEFITNENPNLPAQRRKDIIQYLNANMDYIYGFFLRNLEHSFACLKSETKPDLIKNHLNILSACLNCIQNYVDWININFIFSNNYSLIKIIFSLFYYKELCVDAAQCFISILNRKGSVSDRKPLSTLFNDEILTQIYASIKKSLTDLNFKHLLKYLVQILISIGTQLNTLWCDSQFKSPFDLNLYLNAIFELIISENRLFSYEAVQLWINLMSNQYLATNPIICEATLNLAQIMTNSKLLFKVNPDDYMDEFNSDEDFSKFAQKYRSDLNKLIKLASQLYLANFIQSAYDWASKIIYETMQLDPNDQSGYDSNSFLFLCWDAVLFLWTSLMQNINKKIKDKSYSNENEFNLIKEKLISLLSLCTKFNSPNANYCSFNYSLQSALLISCELDQTEIILQTLLAKLFSDYSLFQNKYIELETLKSDSQILKSIQNLRKQIAANILNICRNYASKLKNSFDDIYQKSLANINSQLATQIERVIFIQSLIFCNNENESSQTQAAFIDQFLRPIYEFFTSQEFQTSLLNLDYFIQFIGLNESDLNAASLQNRRQIFFYLNVLFAVLKSVKSMDGESDETHFAYPSYIKLFEPLLQFIKCLNALHSPEWNTKLKKEYLEMTDAAKTLVIGAQTQSSSVFASTSINLTNESSYYTDKILMFVFNSYEDLHQLIALYFVKFRKELLLQSVNQSSDLVRKCGEALFANFFDLPDFRTRFLVKYSMRGLLQIDFEKKHENMVIFMLNETFLEYFLPSILAKIDQRLKYFKSVKEKQEDLIKYEQIEQQICEENQFILLCREVFDLMRLFFNFNNLTFNNKQNSQLQDDFNTIEDDHENMTENKQEDKSEKIHISELALCLIKKNKTIYQSIILLLFEGFNLPDSSCCLKLAHLAFSLFKLAVVTNQIVSDMNQQQQLIFCLNETISEQIFKSCLNALQIHGEHHEISSLLLNLSYLIYEKFPYQNVFHLVLAKIPNLNRSLFDELVLSNDKINLNKNMKFNDKHRKEIFKKIIQPIVGKNLSQLYKNDIEIRILPALKLNSNKLKDNSPHLEVNICSLFDPNQTV